MYSHGAEITFPSTGVQLCKASEQLPVSTIIPNTGLAHDPLEFKIIKLSDTPWVSAQRVHEGSKEKYCPVTTSYPQQYSDTQARAKLSAKTHQWQ